MKLVEVDFDWQVHRRLVALSSSCLGPLKTQQCRMLYKSPEHPSKDEHLSFEGRNQVDRGRNGLDHALFACSIHIRGISIGHAANPRNKFGAIARARFSTVQGSSDMMIQHLFITLLGRFSSTIS